MPLSVPGALRAAVPICLLSDAFVKDVNESNKLGSPRAELARGTPPR